MPIPLYKDPNQSCAQNADFTRNQAWYDLILAVHPTNPDIVLAGGIDVHRSIDGGATWNDLSNWTGRCSRPFVHADIHNILFRPNNSNEILVGSDGGVDYSANAGNNTVSSPTFTARNTNYNITQFYSCAAKNDMVAGNFIIGGTQDNGTLRFSTPGVGSTSEIRGGDGGFCFIDQDNPAVQITSFTNNNFDLHNVNGSRVSALIDDDDTGSFINPADYDHSGNVLYTFKSRNALQFELYAVRNVGSSNTLETLIGATDISSNISHVKVGRTANTLFIGTQSGRVYKITNTQTPTLSFTRIDNFPSTTGNISCIEIGANDDELLVTLSNFGVASVWYTNNGGTNWVNKDEASHGLPDIPVRWALFNPDNRQQVLLATELGVWSSNDVTATNPGWTASNSGLANVRCDMLRYRTIDKLVILATHGRGIYTSYVFNPNPPVGTEESLLSQSTKTFPNPFVSDFQLDLPPQVTLKAAWLRDLNGKPVNLPAPVQKGERLVFSTGTLPVGMYLLELETNKGKIIKRLVKN